MARSVGRYELVREIGRGGMAVVYLARQTDLDRDVAVKELAAFRAADPVLVGRFLRESRLAGSLNHPNVVTVHEYFEHDGTGYIAMEYFERGSLRQYVKSVSLAQTAAVLEGLLAGLAAAGERGIVHRDLKPENVMVTGSGSVKITDFGIAKAVEAWSGDTVTTTGVTVGTPAYMAPEQAMDKGIDARTDLYAVGVMAYELLAGQVPFHDSDLPLAIVLQHVSEPVPPLQSVKPGIEAALAAWVERMLAKEPGDRPPSAARAWEELEEIVIRTLGPRWRRDGRLPSGDREVEPAPLAVLSAPEPVSHRRRWAVSGLGAAAVVGGVVAAVLLLTGGSGATADRLPGVAEQASLAVSGSNLVVSSGNRQVELDAGTLRQEGELGGSGALAAQRGLVYLARTGGISVLRPAGLTPEAPLPFAGAIAIAGGTDSPLVVATASRVCEISAESKITLCAPIGFTPTGLGSTPTGLVFVADGSGTVWIFKPKRGALVPAKAVEVGAKPHGTLVSSRGRLYVPIERGIAVVDPLNRKFLRVIHLPVSPSAIWVSRFSGRLFAALYALDRVDIIDTTSGSAVPETVAKVAEPVAVWGSGGSVYVFGAGDRSITKLDALTGQRLRAVRLHA